MYTTAESQILLIGALGSIVLTAKKDQPESTWLNIYFYELYARSKIRAKRTIRQSLPIQVFLEAGGPKGEWLALLQLAAKRVPRNQGNFF